LASRRHFIWLLGALALAGAALPLRAGDDWKFDVLHHKNGATFKGLVVKDSPAEVLFYCVKREPGRPTLVMASTFRHSEIDFLEPLSATERAALGARLKALDPTGKGEALRMRNLELQSASWGDAPGGSALRYDSAHFALVSNAREDVVRRAAVRLEQLDTAFARLLPPRAESGQPTSVLLAQSLADYRALLKDQGRTLLNPAFYDPASNRVVCLCDLQSLVDRLEQSRRDNQRLLDDLKDQETELNRVYKQKVPLDRLDQLKKAREKVARTTKDNEEGFEKAFHEATRRLMQRLYHEMFHAYLANFVYPPGETAVPRWLNEGLAQIFDSAILEGDELRIGHADPDRLKRLKALCEAGELVGVSDLLRSGSKQFLVLHATEKESADRHYLTSYGIAFYLTFERRLLGTKAMDRYVHVLHAKADPLEAFRDLVGQPLPQFEKEFQQYVGHLRADGTVAGK
jgi:hypothetical protein